MRDIDIIRAWKDEAYRNRLSEEEQKLLPANPAGDMQPPFWSITPLTIAMVTTTLPTGLTSTYFGKIIDSFTYLIQ
jgi:mersacidin/lichenicidin family type 2 lantibiotic